MDYQNESDTESNEEINLDIDMMIHDLLWWIIFC